MTRPTATAPVEAGEVWAEADTLAHEICGCATASQHRADVKKLLAYRTAAEQRGAERERGKVVAWLREYGNVHCGEDMAISAMRDAGPSFANAIETGAHDG